MISRRKIRIKALQALYAGQAYDLDQEIEPENIKKLFRDSVEILRNEVTTVVWFLYRINTYAETEEQEMESRMLSDTATVVNYQRFLELNFVKSIEENSSFWKRVESMHYLREVENVRIKYLFRKYLELDSTKAFLKKTNGDQDQLLLHLMEEVLMPDPNFQDFMEAHFTVWDDDEHEVFTIVSRIIEKGAEHIDFRTLGINDITQLGTTLIDSVLQNRSYYQDLIKPKLKNWDPKRIARIDMLVLYMGIAEFLHLPSVPVNVTINEYIDIIKQYGAKQSKQFVNAVLDALKNQLNDENLIQKVS